MTVQTKDILIALDECRRAILTATTVVAKYLSAIDEREGGLDHVRRQLQNADIIVMFMERSWRAIEAQERAVLDAIAAQQQGPPS